MPKGWFLKTSPLFATAAVASATGFFTAAPPAHAADCQQWEFASPSTLVRDTTESITFSGSGSHVDTDGTWTSNNGPHKQARVVGDIDPAGHITVNVDIKNLGPVTLTGDVGPNGQANGLSDPNNSVAWHSLAPMACPPGAAAAAAGSKEGPSIDLDPGVGRLTIHITDHSGVASNCQYNSDFVNRSFDLPANGTFDINVVPAVPLLIDHQVDITCTNGTSTHTTKFF